MTRPASKAPLFLSACLGAALALPAAAAASGHAAPLAPLLGPGNVPGALRFITPANQALVTGGPLSVILRRQSRVSSVVLRVDAGRSIPLRAGRRDELIASVRGLRAGTHVLLASGRLSRGRHTAAAVSFVVGRRSRSLVTVRVVQSVSAGRPIDVDVRLAGRTDRLHATLNGASLDGAFRTVRAGRRDLQLGLSQGLRYGGNTLRVTAFRMDGTYDSELHRILVRRDRPLAAAGPDLRLPIGSRLVLRGGGKASGPGDRLAISWRILQSPPGGRPRLSGAHGSHPLLSFRTTGRYVVRETVTETGSGVREARALQSSDDANVTVTPDAPSIALDTMSNAAGGADDLLVDGQTVSNPIEAGTAHLAIFDRATLAQISNGSYCVNGEGYCPSGAGALPSLQDALTSSSLSSNDLVVLTVPPDANALPVENSSAEQQFNQLLQLIGGSPLPTAFEPVGQAGYSTASGFSIVGIPGIPVGQAYENLGLGSTDPTKPAGNLAGALQLDSACSVASVQQCAYKFVPRDYVPFTTASPTATAATITVGSQQLSSGTQAGPGFLVGVYDAGTLAPVAHQTFVVDFQGTPIPAEISAMSGFLNPYVTDLNKVVIIQGFGDPNPGYTASAGRTAWGALSGEIEELHGNRHVFNSLTSTGNYALVGGAGAGVPTAEVSQSLLTSSKLPPGHGTLEGVLGRDNAYRFQARLADPVSGTDFTLLPLAYQASTPWPDSSGDDQLAADWIATQVGSTLAQGWTSVAQMRTGYWTSTDVNWATAAQDVAQTQQGQSQCQIQYPTTKPASWSSSPDGGPSVSEYDTVCTNLATELNQVNKVIDLFGPPGNASAGNLPGAFANAAGTGLIDAELNNAATKIQQAVNPPAVGTEVDSGGIAYASLELTAELTGETLDPALGLAMVGLSFVNALSDDGTGASDQQQVQTSAATAATKIATNIANSAATLNLLGEILVSDPAKLAAAARDYGNLWNSATSPGTIGSALLSAATQTEYTSILGAIYSGYIYYQAGTTNSADLICYTGGFNGSQFNPFTNEGPDGQMQWLASFDSNGNPVNITFALTHTLPLGSAGNLAHDTNFNAPPESVMSTLFSPISSGGAGFLRPYFFEDQLPHAQLYCSHEHGIDNSAVIQVGPAYPVGGPTYPLAPPCPYPLTSADPARAQPRAKAQAPAGQRIRAAHRR